MPSLKIKKTNLRWAIKYLNAEGDTDLFPKPFELSVIKKNWVDIEPQLLNIDLSSHNWKKPRSLLVPKSELSFRAISQLDPIDSILITGLIKQIGRKIEIKRIPYEENRVFSYRFSGKDGLYRFESGWDDFWNTSLQLASESSYVLVTDISDWYNQIYHHTIENQIINCGFPTEVSNTIKRFLNKFTENVSRGIPVGPHATHLIAEIAANPIDNFIKSNNYQACRYVDDIHIFCQSERDAVKILYKLTDFLNTNHKISLNSSKTKISTSKNFKEVCDAHINDRPINAYERDILLSIRDLSTNPYKKIRASDITPEAILALRDEKVSNVLDAYMKSEEIDFVRLRWFIRRLAQTGQPSGLEYIINNFDEMLPAIADICRFLYNCSENYTGDWKDIGGKVINIIDGDFAASNSYIRMILFNLFSEILDMNHIASVINKYDGEDPICRREIALAASNHDQKAWISSLKSRYDEQDAWHKRSIINSMRVIPKDERKFWGKSIKNGCSDLEKILIKEYLT